MKIGLYFGSFNPIHIGHLIIASHVINNTEFKKIWFIISPQNPLKPSLTLLNGYQRLHLLRLATEDDSNFKASDIEFKLPKPSYTIHTITILKEKYPTHEFGIIMGSDSFNNLSKWRDKEKIINENNIIVYTRPGFCSTEIQTNANVLYLTEAPLLEISATSIRKLIHEGKSIRYLVSDKVREEIEKNGYYKK